MKPANLFLSMMLIVAVSAGCSKTAKPDAATLATNSPRNEAGADGRRNANPPAGSLEDLQRGTPPVTPKDSALKEVYFDFDSYELRADARETLKADAQWLKRNPGVRVTVEGHCDERGTTEYNLALGAKRAQAAKEYLVALGIAADRISTMSYGSEAAVCREHSENCWQKNRRDRLVALTARSSM
jgi:peptidoglycan-associated lipoprotein